MRILVVEDDEANADLLKMCLDAFTNHEARIAHTVQSALRELETGWPELVLLDWYLGNITAAPLIPEIKARAIPSILVTAVSKPDQIAEVHNIAWLVRKPYDCFELVSLIDRISAGEGASLVQPNFLT